MGAFGSGARRKARRPEGWVLPPWGNSEESIRARLDAVSAAYYRGEIDTREYDLETKASIPHLRSVGQERDRLQMERLTTMLADAKEVVARGQQHAAAARRHVGDGDSQVQNVEETDGEVVH